MNTFSENSCPKCGFYELKSWENLNEEEKIVAAKLSLNVEFTDQQRENNLFCTRCWFEVPYEISEIIT